MKTTQLIVSESELVDLIFAIENRIQIVGINAELSALKFRLMILKDNLEKARNHNG